MSAAIEIPGEKKGETSAKTTSTAVESPMIIANHLTPLMNPRSRNYGNSPGKSIGVPNLLRILHRRHHLTSVISFEYEVEASFSGQL